MNIELDEVVVQDVSDESLELAAGGAQVGASSLPRVTHTAKDGCSPHQIWC